MAPKIETISYGSTLSEGPHWDIPSQSLYFIDCFAQRILRYDPATKRITGASTAPHGASFIIPVEGTRDKFIISLDKELAIVTWDGVSDKLSAVEKVAVADDAPETENNRFNDGKCDSSGRLWAGTLDINRKDIEATMPKGTVYSFDTRQKLKAHVGNIRLSNGIAFNDKTKKMFYIDSLKRTVDRFDFDIINATISNRQVWFSLQKNNIPGIPDGMTIDTDGYLWVAVYDGSRVIQISGTKPETLLNTVTFPIPRITSVTFGGPNLDELYVTSANYEDADVTKLPKNTVGAIYRVTGVGAKGLPGHNFKLN